MKRIANVPPQKCEVKLPKHLNNMAGKSSDFLKNGARPAKPFQNRKNINF
jgi:predicted lipid carrier protein YhbT